MPINVALVGGGIWAREEHLPAIVASKDLVLKAVYSRTNKSALSIADNVSYPLELYSDEDGKGFDVLLERTDIKAVVISLPIKNQVEYIRKALLAGKHVLSEKPVGENIEDAKNLIKWYRTEIKGSSWCVAENWRFLESYKYAAEHIKALGRVLAFYGKQHSLVVPEGKFYQTEWRKNPTHQGGFLLDGGVHYIAGIRQLLAAQDGSQITQVSAFTALLRDYLPPVDTAHAIFKTQSGATGSFQISVGSSSKADEWTVECEHGWVKINGHGGSSEVTVSKDGQVTTETIQNEKTGVPPEIRAWGEALVAGRVNKEQEPETALADLELIGLFSGSSTTINTTISAAVSLPLYERQLKTSSTHD